MSTAELIADPPHSKHAEHAGPRKRRPPLALRPLHRMWRKTIDGLEVTRIELPVRALAEAHRGVVACQISDFHVDRDEDLARLHAAVGAINRERPELVFLTGDYFSGPDTMQRFIAPFREALSGLKPACGVIAILGNHDHWSSAEKITAALRGAGAEVLANENRRVMVRGHELIVAGIDDLWSRHAEPARALAGVQPGESAIVLAHNPDTALYARHLHPGVMLSGHTHGGVVRIPYYGSPLKSILRIGKRFYSGLNQYEDFYIYTNRGLGTFWLRIRINCRPEISRFSLVPFDSAAIRTAPDAHAEAPADYVRPRRRMRRRSPVRAKPPQPRRKTH
ncbi:MAG TPA: metallophosphoesterase [Candidatus Binataceae bacterium]|nr:metallophosphoesterase [Candidatus Binataceae bacterium]